MGIVFGQTGCEEPTYKSLRTTGTYDVRLIQPYFVAEAVDTPGKSDSFNVLAKYIGVFGVPQNTNKQAMAMTAPVINEPTKMAMTAPVINSKDEVMSFVLPFNLKTLSEIPQPTDGRIRIREVPQRVLAVKKFSGWYSDEEATKQRQELQKALQADELVRDGEAFEWSVAQYHPPFTLPFMRRNEIWIQLDEKKEQVKELLK